MNKLMLLPLLTATLSTAALAARGDEKDGTCSTTAACKAEGKSIVETAMAAGEFKTLGAALEAAHLVGALEGEGPFTVFAPTDAAFAALPEGTLEALLQPENRGTLTTILTYHVVPGRVAAADVLELENAQALNGQRIGIATSEGVQVAGVNVIKTDILCSNGIIHVVDAVMMPSTKNVVQTAVEAGSFKTLAAALKAAGLVDVLQGDGPFTVLAPTDEAFAALPEGTLESLLQPENKDQLIGILKYHVLSGRTYADQLDNGSAKTLQGSSIAIRLKDGKVSLNDAHVVQADLETTNGVIHVIDRVLLPH